LLLRSGPAEAATAGVMKGYVAGACAIAICAWIMPAQTDLRLGDDELLGPNQIGFVCALAIFFAQYLMRSSGARLRLATAFLAITLLRSLSKTTIVAVVLGETVLLFRDKFISRKTKIWIVVAAVVVLAIFSGLLSSYFEIYSNAGNQAETLTGRLGIWGYFLEKAIEQPWIGHGFHSVWKVIPPFGKDQFEARHAHNEVLQQFYAYGVAGVVMLAGLYLSFYRNVRRMPASAVKTLLLGLLVFVLVRGLADTEAFDLTLPLWAIPMFTSAMVWRASN
jgi:O-antigen ligase